jgi:hypothetical protein
MIEFFSLILFSLLKGVEIDGIYSWTKYLFGKEINEF